MGQYYRPVVELDDEITVYNRDVDEEYTMAKLTEHSWIGNHLMSAISEKFYMTKGRLLWCGDYAEDDEIEKTGLTVRDIWDVEGKGVAKADFEIDWLYLCNHDTKEFVNIEKYIKNSTDKDDWCMHPLSLLTAVGNQRGGGDYYGVNSDLVGIWFWNLISFEPQIPEGYKEFEIQFIDR